MNSINSASHFSNTDGFSLNKYTKVLADELEFPLVKTLNSTARQASAERAWGSISRFYENWKKKTKGKKGFLQVKKFSRSVEYKTCGWKLSEDKKYLTITDKTRVGRLKLVGSIDLNFYQIKQIKRIRLVKKADGYYPQFGLNQDRKEITPKTGSLLGIDLGLESFLTDSNGKKLENPRFLRKSEKKSNFLIISYFRNLLDRINK
ncbi:transposase [Pleurocapsales cyanobacterium LEGE 06147]|nr:transposase [Pleurocapsales cyanobacterium LEGE 06147]